ncbi:Holliday junction branch migration protein RuvA [Pseudothermotoga thermarum]|uniref:Holliday junction branch migration complex subunit RuvA n=1 Tax=Pseudothermotoga thermarum DSM 5069 TaxID=688269 RepID=F7YWM1_9THEM|nr:Holliday junction branch migration protein RuvA [Pseudothermotoga thermarum]AEH52004.1 Holliday junction DNA helicase RuvA [Pseudothermotoga thermarum DSM 5069]
MIYSVSGTVVEKFDQNLLLKVGNFVLQVFCDFETFEKVSVGQLVQLYTYLQLNQDEVNLYGFLDLQKLKVFRKIMKVSKMGPKTALKILSVVQPREFVWLVKKGEINKLSALPGIGKKTAERLVAELKDEDFEIEADFSPEIFDAVEALVALGFSREEARQAVLSVFNKDMDVEQLIKESLKILSRKDNR